MARAMLKLQLWFLSLWAFGRFNPRLSRSIDRLIVAMER